MEEKIRKRLKELESEYRKGVKMLSDLDAERTRLQEKMLEIRGAVQVLNEFLSAGTQEGDRTPEDKATPVLSSVKTG